jgi:glycosyltransferase involved in cell wall biosynthesis
MATPRSYTILHTEASWGWGGQERRILAEALAMRRRGHRLLLACDPRGDLFVRGRVAGLPVFPLAFGGRRNFGAVLALRRLLRDERVEILNTHSSLDSWVGLAAWKSLWKRPLLVRTRHLSTLVRNNWPTRMLYRAPAAVITTGEATRELLFQRLGVPRERLFSIPTGVSLTEFAPRDADPERRRGLQIPAEAFVFGVVAVLRSWKGHLFVLEALRELRETGAPAFLVVVGDGPYRGPIEEKVAALDLHDRVRLTGYQDEVAPWLAMMDVVILASYANEGVPQALLQALAMARPVVGTQVGGIPEVVFPGETGLLVPPKDPAALARAMGQLMADRELGPALGKNGRRLVEAKFSLEDMAARVEAVYDGVSQGRGG